MTDILKKAMEDSAKKYGEGATMYFDDFASVEVQRISTGLPSLDLALNGGFPVGRLIEIYGPESSGKTTLAIKFLIECQKAEPDKPVMFIDVEHALDPAYAEKLGLKIHGKSLIFKQPNSAEEAIVEMMKYAATGAVSGIVLDSVASLVMQSQADSEDIKAEMGGRARLLSGALPKLVAIAAKTKCTCFFINQTRSKLGVMYGNPETTPGGAAMKFFTSQRIRSSIKKIDDNTGEVTMKVLKNKCGVPFRSTKILVKYGIGFDYINDVITTALLTGVISKNGPMYSFEDQKWKGQETMRAAIIGDEKLQQQIQKVISDSTSFDTVLQPQDPSEEIEFATGDVKE